MPLDDAVGDEVLAHAVALHHGFDHGLGHVAVVGEQLLGVLGQAIAAIAEARIVIMAADAWVHAHAVDDLLRVQALALGVSVELVEIAHTDGEVCVGEELDGLGLGRVGDQDRDVLVLGAFLEEVGEEFGVGLLVLVGAHDDTARVEVVVEGLALAKEFGREDDVVHAVLLADGVGVTYGNGGFDDHHDLRIDLQDMLDGVLDGRGVEEVVLVVIVGRSGDHHEFGGTVGRVLVHGGAEVELALALLRFAEEPLDLVVLNRADEVVEFSCFLGGGGNRRHLVMLGEQYREGKSHVPYACYSNFHGCILLFVLFVWYSTWSINAWISIKSFDLLLAIFATALSFIFLFINHLAATPSAPQAVIQPR